MYTSWPAPKLADCFWYHTLDLPDGSTVQGQWDLRGRFADYTGQVPVKGRRVLDIGTASGFLTWEAEKAGAEVVSFDLDHAKRQKLLPFRDQPYFADPERSQRERQCFFDALKRSYWYMHHALNSKARVYYGDIENLPAGLGRFDTVVFGSVLEHLPDHIQAIASAARLTDEIVITGSFDVSEDRHALFAGWANHPEASYSFWRYTVGIYREVLRMLGFEIDRVSRSTYRCLLNDSDTEMSTIVAVHR